MRGVSTRVWLKVECNRNGTKRAKALKEGERPVPLRREAPHLNCEQPGTTSWFRGTRRSPSLGPILFVCHRLPLLSTFNHTRYVLGNYGLCGMGKFCMFRRLSLFLAMILRYLSFAFLCSVAQSQVVINEFAAASSDRLLRWTADGSPRLGTGIPWQDSAFLDAGWLTGTLPAGYGSTVSTNLQTAMVNKTPSCYFRKSFTVSPAQAALTQPLTLQVDCNDGFVAYINGVEVARANAGAAQHFLFAGQPAYNKVVGSGVVEYTLAATNTLLVAGTNVLSIQAHNALENPAGNNFAASANFRLNAGLKIVTSTTPIQLTKAFYDHDAATGATKTRQRTGTTDTNSSSGTPISAGWLATATDPTTTGTWSSLNIVTGEIAGAGLGGSGGLRYTVAQTGANGTAAWLRAPSVNMVNAWAPNSLSLGSLGQTTVSFRYRTTGDLQFGLRMDPAIGQEGNSADGFPVIGLPIGGTADYNWASASGGHYGLTMDAAGNQGTILGGSISIGNYEVFANTNPNGAKNGQVSAREDNTAGAGPGGSTGVFTGLMDIWPTGLTSMNLGVKNIIMTEWTAGSVTLAQFQATRVSFRWKLPVGRQMHFALEENNTTSPIETADRANIGILNGTGNWEAFTASLSDLNNSTALRTRLNNNFSKTMKLTMHYTGVPFVTGEKVQVDDLSLYTEVAGQTLEENLPNTFSLASGGTVTRTVTGAGVGSSATTGTLVNTITAFQDPGVTGMAFRMVESSAAGSDGTPGHLRCEVTDTPDTGAPWGFSITGPTIRNWTKGAITVQQLSEASLVLSTKIPSGVTVQLYGERVGGSSSNRVNLGTLTGNGTWQSVTKEFAGAGNVEAFRTDLNTANSTQFQLTFIFPSNPVAGEQLALDDVRILPWRLYSTLLSGGTVGNQQRFVDYLNANSLITFIPTFVKNTIAPAAGGSFSTDNFQVTYLGPDPNALQQIVGLGAAGWKYFVGIAEPSGGLFDPILLAGFTVPPGQEDEYESPQNFRDWVELHNPTGSAVSIAGWSLSDELDTPLKFVFPAGTSIPAGGYLIVMCDDREEANGTATYIHAGFSLSASGEAIRLYNAGGVLQSAVTNIPQQDSFYSWGRNPNGDGSYGFLDTATPGVANTGSFYSSRVKTPDFYAADGITKLPGGFYSAAQTLRLISETPGATIRYTLDGTEPTETNGTVYTAPLSVTSTGDGKTARSYRVRAFVPGLVPSDSKVHSYLITMNANLSGVPALLFTADAGRNFYAPHGIMAIVGGTYPGAWAANGPQSYNLPINRGDSYERVTTAEWYYPDGKDGWRDDVGIRVSSSPYSRPLLRLENRANSPWVSDHVQKPSFNLKWRDDYGSSSVTDPNLIPANDTNTYNELRIRAGKNDILDPFIIDEVSRRLYRDMGWFSPIGTIGTVYFNGSFKGMFNPTERVRAKMFKEHYRTDNDFDVRYIGEQVDGDTVFWNAMVTALNTHNSNPTLANYNAALNYIDPVNVADYFLTNIYINTEDWPGNNWAAQRERTAAGRYRMVMWDAEGAFSRFGQAINSNTIDGKCLANTECSNCFRLLYPNPEFKLLVADRINKYFFNNGLLDDRDTVNSPIAKHINFFKAKVDPLLRFLYNNAGESVDLGWYTSHQNPATGRRAYLFGTAAGSFSNKGLWPATQPPTLSQNGGIVSANYPLTITSPSGGTIYYTTNGTDPRLAGGAVSGSASTYTGAVNLNALTTVKVRVRSAGGEWSALTEAYFQPGAVLPTASTLLITEINYHPPAPTAAEEALGYIDADDFEFIRLTNISANPLDLRTTQFTGGITFIFGTGDILALPAGGNLLLVKRKAAFEARYGTSFSSLIAGEYGGGLSNGGESLRLDITTPSIVNIALFSYKDDSDPTWPATPDGYGPSLVLKAPATLPNPALGASWMASAQPGGLPGGVVRILNYTIWKNLSFDPGDAANNAISGLTADPDGDGINNLIEYGLGGNPLFNDATALLSPATIESNYLTYSYRVNAGASDATITPQVSGDLTGWLSGAGNILTLSGPTAREDGVNLYTVRDTTLATGGNRYIRLRMVAP